LIDLTGNKKILIVRLGKIGDIIIASAAIEVLKNKFPDVGISLLTLKKNKEVLKYNSNISHLYLTNKNLSLYFKLFLLRKFKYDVLIDLNDDPSKTSILIRKLINSKITVGFDFNEDNKPGIAVVQPSKSKTHIIERIKLLLTSLNAGLDEIELHPKLYLGKIEKLEVFEELKQYKDNSKILAINISAGAPIRYWKENKWSELINKISNEFYDWKFIILSTKKDEIIKKSICGTIQKERLISQKFYSFQHYASYVCYSDILLTPDTAAVHIASTLNVPVIALYPNYEWNFVSWQPLSKYYRAIRSNSESINNISVEEVYNAFKDILSEIKK